MAPRSGRVLSAGREVPLDHLWATWRSNYVTGVADSRDAPSPDGERDDGRSLFERILAADGHRRARSASCTAARPASSCSTGSRTRRATSWSCPTGRSPDLEDLDRRRARRALVDRPRRRSWRSQGRVRLRGRQRRGEPRRGGRAGRSPTTSTSTACPAGSATRTSSRGGGDPRAAGVARRGLGPAPRRLGGWPRCLTTPTPHRRAPRGPRRLGRGQHHVPQQQPPAHPRRALHRHRGRLHRRLSRPRRARPRSSTSGSCGPVPCSSCSVCTAWWPAGRCASTRPRRSCRPTPGAVRGGPRLGPDGLARVAVPAGVAIAALLGGGSAHPTAFVIVDGIDGSVIEGFAEDNPEDWAGRT